ncbi:MAG: sel1 repeat family protein [Endomicrobia bacterium]|nr:sel1 repeat family protein [Endomicrobiia bacterium]
MKNILFAVFVTAAFFTGSGLALAQKKAVNPNSPEDVAELRSDAEKGDRGAQYELSMVYTYKQDAENALKWLTKSAENGYGRAQYTLGNLYYTGSGKVKRDYEKAVKWFEASKETKYKGAKVDELITLAKQKFEDEKKALAAKKKAAEEAKKKAAAEAAKKEKEAKEAKEAEIAAKAQAEQQAKEAAEAEQRAAEEAAAKAEEEAKKAAEAEKSIFQKIKEKILSFFNY